MTASTKITPDPAAETVGKTQWSAVKNSAKTLVRRVASEWVKGAIDFYRYPQLRNSWGGPLNGQKHRQGMVEAFARELPLDAIVETGTYRGTTTSYLARLTSHAVYTVEFNRRLQGFSWVALRGFKNVHCFGGDSRLFLHTLAKDESLRGKTIFFYLDAHWNADLPLSEELEIIFAHWALAVVLIDDFQVVDDLGYGYDDYGSGSALVLDYIAPVRKRFGISVFYPSLLSAQETGLKRGSVTLAADSGLIRQLRNISEVREYVT
jgi:hypothetical protein